MVDEDMYAVHVSKDEQLTIQLKLGEARGKVGSNNVLFCP